MCMHLPIVPFTKCSPSYLDLHTKTMRWVTLELFPCGKNTELKNTKGITQRCQQKRTQTQAIPITNPGPLTPRHVETLSGQISIQPWRQNDTKQPSSQLIWINWWSDSKSFSSIFSCPVQEDCNRDSQGKKCERLVQKVTYYYIKSPGWYSLVVSQFPTIFYILKAPLWP